MGSFYTYFASKEAFYSDILDAIEQRGSPGSGKAREQPPLPALPPEGALPLHNAQPAKQRDPSRHLLPGRSATCTPARRTREQRQHSLFARIEALIEEILAEGTRRGMFRTSLFRNPKSMLIAIFSAVSLNGASSTEMADDVMMLIERGLKRWLGSGAKSGWTCAHAAAFHRHVARRAILRKLVCQFQAGHCASPPPSNGHLPTGLQFPSSVYDAGNVKTTPLQHMPRPAHILVVDDEAEMCTSLAKLLGRKGLHGIHRPVRQGRLPGPAAAECRHDPVRHRDARHVGAPVPVQGLARASR